MTPKEAHKALQEYGSKRAASKKTGVPRTTFRRLLQRYEKDQNINSEVEGCDERLETKWHQDGSLSIIVQGQSIKTKEDALAYAGMSEDEWEVKECQITSWSTPMKLKNKTGDDQPLKIYNFRVAIKAVPKAKPTVQFALESLIEQIDSDKFILPEPKLDIGKGNHSYVLSLYDHHFGMLAWGKEVGQDYDLKIQDQYFVTGGQKLLAKAASMPPDEIVLPIGNDFFHINDPNNATPKNHNRLDVDGRMAKIFEVGFASVIKTVALCRKIAPVKIYFVPGNHDPNTSWFLVFSLKQAFKDDPHVTVDCGPKVRKVYKYGVNVIMFTHAADEKEADLPMLLVDECGFEMLENTFVREVHTGHYHQRKERESKRTYNHQGTTMRRIGSLCPRDFYGYTKGYLAPRAAELFVYNKETGLCGEFLVSDREVQNA